MDTATMMKKAKEHVVDMMLGKKGDQWNAIHPMYEGVCGWCGVMAPMNRPAFVAKFGEDFTKAVETAAQAELAHRADFWQNSKANQYMKAAAENITKSPFGFKVGDFVLGRMMNLKCEGDFIETLKDCVNYPDSLGEVRLCRIDKVIECEAVPADKIEYRMEEGKEGGADSDDITDEIYESFGSRFSNLPKEYKDTVYTKCVLVRDEAERYYLIDFEGFTHARYIIVPVNWETMYKGEVFVIRAEKERQEKEEAEAKAKEEAKARADYDARCEKWAGMMEKVPEGLPHYTSEYRKIGKRNVLKMAKAAFPWVRFSVSYDGGWGTGYVLKWKNGPTVDEVKKAGDYGLFMPWWDTFDGMTDCAGSESAKFKDFSDKFGGVGNGVKFEREECEKDQNGDPNGKPPAPPKPTKGKGGEEAEIRENWEKNGVEIYFPSIPSAGVRNELKANGWRWSRIGGIWYNKATDTNREIAAKIVAMFNNERAAA